MKNQTWAEELIDRICKNCPSEIYCKRKEYCEDVEIIINFFREKFDLCLENNWSAIDIIKQLISDDPKPGEDATLPTTGSSQGSGKSSEDDPEKGPLAPTEERPTCNGEAVGSSPMGSTKPLTIGQRFARASGKEVIATFNGKPQPPSKGEEVR